MKEGHCDQGKVEKKLGWWLHRTETRKYVITKIANYLNEEWHDIQFNGMRIEIQQAV